MCLAGETCALGDVNGDGKADAIAFTQGGNPGGGPPGTAWAELSNGSAFGPPAEWSGHICLAGETCLTGDVDGSVGADAVAFTQGSGTNPGTAWAALSTGTPLGPSATTVPSVLGLSRDDAGAAITAAGLVPNVLGQRSCADPGDVIIEDPRGGAEVPAGTTVNITVDTCTTPK